MSKKRAKAELEEIRKQKTVMTTRLNRILDVLDYDKLERDYINLSKNTKRLKRKLNDTSSKYHKLKKEIGKK